MTGQRAATGNVLLLNFVDFRTMPVETARPFYLKVKQANLDEVRRGLEKLMQQTNGVFPASWITEIAILMMDRLGLEYAVYRTDLTTGEIINVRQNRQVDQGTSRSEPDDSSVPSNASATGGGELRPEQHGLRLPAG